MKNISIQRLFIDVETGKADDYENYMPEEISNPKPFNKNSIKRLKKDTDDSYNEKLIAGAYEYEEYKEKKKNEWISKCALSPLTGQILCVGFAWDESEAKIRCQADEWTEQLVLQEAVIGLECADLIIGHNIREFDLHFIAMRCKKHGITFPDKLYSSYKGKYNWNEHIIDTSNLWQLGKYKDYISLNNLCKYFGLEPKNDYVSKNFEHFFNNDFDTAIQHCKDDVNKTREIYYKLTGCIKETVLA